MSGMQLATIGYEGAALPDFIATLIAAGIEQVIDVREIAQSRRPGFSKNALKTALAEVGIGYYHFRQLGDPKEGRDAARAGRYDLFQAIFSVHIDLPASREALTAAVSLATNKKSVLVCFERDARYCHRTIVAVKMMNLGYFQITNLGVGSMNERGVREDAGSTNRLVGAC